MNKKIFIYSVASSIAATIIFTLILAPLSQWLWDVSANSANEWIIEVQNSAFKNAALGVRSWVSALSFLSVYIIIFSCGSGILIGIGLVKLKKLRSGNQAEEEKPRLNRNGIFLIVAIQFFWFAYLGGKQAFFVYTDIQMNASFEQRMNAIRPYIDEQEAIMLRSKWALMKNRKEYETIHNNLDTHASKVNIQLPHLLYK